MEEPIFIKCSECFRKGVDKNDDEKKKTELFRKVGQLQMEVDFFKKIVGEKAGNQSFKKWARAKKMGF